jgi:hypothetical protein
MALFVWLKIPHHNHAVGDFGSKISVVGNQMNLITGNGYFCIIKECKKMYKKGI